MFRIAHYSLLGLLAVLMIAVTARAEMYKGYETPGYTVTDRDGAVELRAYAPHLVAEVTVDGSRSRAAQSGFMTLARYIFGGNATGDKVAMTTPVSQLPAAAVGQDGWVVQFMMPAEFDRATLPAPRDPAIRFTETPAETLLVVRFSGGWGQANLDKHSAILLEAAQARDLTVLGAPRYLFYDAPFTLPWNRRNEVAIPVK